MKGFIILTLSVMLALFSSLAQGRRGGFLSTTGSFQLSSGGAATRGEGLNR